jgi:hypothetical protein
VARRGPRADALHAAANVRLPTPILLALTLSGCSWQGSLGVGVLHLPPGEKIVETAAGPVEVPDTPAIVASPVDTVGQGLQQAQTVRTLVRSLSR